MKRMHGVSLLKRTTDDDSNETSHSSTMRSKTTAGLGPMNKFLLDKNEQTMQAVIARMTSCDGLPFRVFVTSPDLNRALTALGFGDLPTSAETIKQLVMNQGRKVRSFVESELANRKKEGQRFSLTFDEWTSTRNRRYMNVNVHEQGPKFWSLGLVRVQGKMPATTCIALLEKKLGEFGLDLKHDIVCIVTDGASVMTAVGKLIDAEQQLCYAHGVQLAVLDVLYKRRNRSIPSTPTVAKFANIDSESETINATVCYNNDDDDSDVDIEGREQPLQLIFDDSS